MWFPTRTPPPPIAFFSDAANAGLTKWVSATNPSCITIVNDPTLGATRKVMKFVVPDDIPSPTENPRAQLSATSGVHINDEFCLSFGLYLPTGDYTLTGPYDWVQFMQVYGPPFNGYPPLNLSFRNDSHGSNYGFGWIREPDAGDAWACKITPQFDAWMDFFFRCKVSPDPAIGFVEIWTNFGTGWQARPMSPIGGTVTTTGEGGSRLHTATLNAATALGQLRTDAQIYRSKGDIPLVTSYITDHRRIASTGTSLTDIATINPGSY